MKAAVFHGIGDIRDEDRQRPKPSPHEALLKIGAAGICGTDLRIFSSGHHRIPANTTRVLGHELAGEIVEVGSEGKSLTAAIRVGGAPNMRCGMCTQCGSCWSN